MRTAWKFVVGLTFLTSLTALILAAVLFSNLADTTHHADRDIFKSRIGSVAATCHKFNDVQATLSDLITVSLDGPKPRGLTAEEERHIDKLIARFRHDRKLLAPNDCHGMRRKLDAALKGNHFERSVPYSP